jgi:uncharacterized damage-inducible protein DinB
MIRRLPDEAWVTVVPTGVEALGMSSELQRLEEQLRRSLEGGAWHGPAVLEALEGVSPEQAAAHPIAGAHSIWELALHLASDYRLVLRRMNGDGSQLTPDEDWPAVPPPTPKNWSDTIQRLRQLSQDLRRAVLNFSPDRLDEPLVPESPYTAYVQFIGVTQHALYHTGQVAVLKRALRTAQG